MAEALVANGADVTFGDLIFGLNWDHPIKSLQTLDSFAKLLAPLLTKLPVRWFYPMGAKQSERKPQHQGYFLENDIIAGDFHFIRRFMPDNLAGKTIITNTVTAGDRKLLLQCRSTLSDHNDAVFGRTQLWYQCDGRPAGGSQRC